MDKTEQARHFLASHSGNDSFAVEKRLDAMKNELRQELSALRYRVECVARDLDWLQRHMNKAA